MFGGIFSDFLSLSWEEARGYIQEELEQMRVAIQARFAAITNADGTLSTDAIAGSATADVPSYIANTGPKKSLKWDKVDLGTGVKNRLRYQSLPSPNSPNSLIAHQAGVNYQEIGLEDDDLTIDSDRLQLVENGVVAGEYGDATHVPVFTVDETGRVTEVEEVEITGVGGVEGPHPEWSILTNGDVTTPELIFAGGDVIMLRIG